MFLQTIWQWLYPVCILMALLASLRCLRLSKYAPLLSGGFGLLLAGNLLAKLLPIVGKGLLHAPPAAPYSYYTTPYHYVFLAISVVGMIGWGLIPLGFYLVMEEVSQKLALLQLAPQNGWNYQAAPNPLQGVTIQNQQAQSQQNQSPFSQAQQVPAQPPLMQQSVMQQPLKQQPLMQQSMTQPYQEGQEQFREQTDVSPFAPPAAPAPPAQDGRPVVLVQPEQPDAPLTLRASQ